ncbi:MAG: transposase [Bacteroidales bacterium]|nr:transposase [Bacteroidales bacterium]
MFCRVRFCGKRAKIRKISCVGTFFPSDTCSVCGYPGSDLTLSDREWTCPECGTHYDLYAGTPR